ncbi:cytochrome P450 [Actinomadura verrucosospora]|uniref:Cytochrome P450 Cyp128 n=1 Tax=Actinomadura verrucosospora TaxID=46165 RepID=A0A7D3VNG7_ACTVE|nr:cytochrome P450 [Actinomadura verrucosospora]QKG18715.1 cytochrome P450 Cyp128 [Actinomadura verrucosospora]
MKLLSRPTPQFGTPTTGTDKARILLATTAEIAVTNGRAAITARRHQRSRGLPPGVEPTTYDPLDRAVIADPYPAYRQLLAGGPVAYNKRRDLYVISHYEAVREAARADTALSSAEGITRARVRLPMMITMDRPRHTRLRRAVLPGFTKPALQRWNPTIDALAADLVDGLRAAPGADMVGRLAVPLPVRIIAHVLGIPPEHQDVFRTWSDWIVEGFQLELRPDLPMRFGRSVRGLLRLSAYLQRQLDSGRLLEGDGVLGRLQRDTADGTISAEELFWFTTLLLVAGNETTTNLLSTMFLTLAEHPEQYGLLRERPELVTAAVEEQLRFSSPIQGFYRTATTDYQIGDAVIPARSRVLLLFGAANRDPRQFTDPDVFDVTRPPSQHVAFGSGIHLCLGAHLARAEGQAVLRHLLETTGRVEVTGRPVWNTNSALRGLHHLPVTLH